MRRCPLLPALLIAPLIAMPGCGGSGDAVWVTGKLLKGGAKYDPPPDQLVSITFVALQVRDKSGKTATGNEPYLADFDPTAGTFAVRGAEGRGIPPGKYRVAVTRKMKREAFDALSPQAKPKGATRETDMMSGRFGLDSSPIVREITSPADLEIDLDKPGGP